jgi:hypothetical protein
MISTTFALVFDTPRGVSMMGICEQRRLDARGSSRERRLPCVLGALAAARRSCAAALHPRTKPTSSRLVRLCQLAAKLNSVVQLVKSTTPGARVVGLTRCGDAREGLSEAANCVITAPGHFA